MIDNLLNESCICKDKNLLKDKELLSCLLENMMLIRKFEEKVLELFKKGLLHGTAHLGIGEEAAGAGTSIALREEDYILVTHRGHGQIIGKGCDIGGMMAEILGKAGGLCNGRGGSMHMADFDKGVLCANGIVGANAPMACGAALTIKKQGLDRVSVAFFGDGASNQGAVHEAMNLAAAWDLPVIFCLVNNGYAISTPIKDAARETDLVKRAAGYGMIALECDGNDVLQVYEATKKARGFALGQGPVLLIEHTYRTSGHSKSDANRYRTIEEINEWRRRDPIMRFEKFLLENEIFKQTELDGLDEKTTETIENAASYAQSLPEPEIGGVLENVYA